jgi:peptide/nickel transport system substrate-binding protein
MDAVLANWVFTIFLQTGSGYIFTGPYAVQTFVAGSRIDLTPNQYYSQAANRPLLVINKYSNGYALADAVAAGQLDMAFHLPIQNVSTLRQVNGVAIKSQSVGYQYMMWHNMRRAPLSDVQVRQAVDKALDRNQLTQALSGGSGTRSFFPFGTPYYLSDSQLGSLNADTSGAESLLTAAGWALNGSGIRVKAGVPLTLKLVAYPQRPGLVTIQPVIKQTLEALGIIVNSVTTSGASWDELDAIIAAKDYDLLEWAQHTLPAGDPLYFTSGFFRSGAGNNYAGLNSTTVDNLIDTLSGATGAARVTASNNAQQAILNLVPVSILMTPQWHVGVGSRLSNYQPYGADYYVINANFGVGSLPLKVGQTFMANSIDPVSGSTGWALVSHGIAEKLFVVDSSGAIVPQIAQSVQKISTFEWQVTLKSDYKFSDGTTVTAAHVAAALTLLNTNNTRAQASLGTMTVTAPTSTTVKIVSTRSTPVMDAVLANYVFVIFLQTNNGYIFTGPYAVGAFVANSQIHMIPNQYYSRATSRPLLVIQKFSNGYALAQALEAKTIDMAFHLPIQNLTALRAVSGITVKSQLVGYQYMMWHNMRRSPLSDVKVRQAVDEALDRNQLTQALSGGTGTRSFFPSNTPYYLSDSQLGPLNANTSGAESLLNAAGWALNGSGIRVKAGVPLTLKLVAYPQRPGLVTIQPVIKQALEALGITVNSVTTSGANWNELDAIIAAKDYDLLEWAQHTLPAGDPQYFENDFFRSGAGNNYAGLNSTTVDNLIDVLSSASGAARVTASNNAELAILNQVPVSILMTPQWHVGLGTRLSSYTPYGADYYVITADFGVGSLPSTVNVSFENVVCSSASGCVITDAAAGTTTASPVATTASPVATTVATTGEARQVTGSLTVTTNDPAAFASNTAVRTALQQAIAQSLSGIEESMVGITNVSVARRLSDFEDERRLSGDVNVHYTITIPASATGVATPTTASMVAVQDTIKTSLTSKLQSNGVSGITVTSVVADAISVATNTQASSNPSNPSNDETSGAYRVIVSGLSVVSLSLINSLFWM